MEAKYIHLLLPASIWEEIYEVGEEEYNKARLYAKEEKEYKQEMKDIAYYERAKKEKMELPLKPEESIEGIIFSIGVKKLVKDGLKVRYFKEFFGGD